MEEFPDLLDCYASEKQQVVFLGDINFHYDSTTDNYVKTLKAMLSDRNLQQVVDKPTHKNKHILDWLIKRDNDDSVNAIQVLDKALSDHFVVYFNILNASIPVEKKTVTSRKLKEINHGKISQDMRSIQTSPDGDPEDLVSQYNTGLEQLLNKHAPEKTRVTTTRQSAPWLNDEIKLLKQQRRQAERSWRKDSITVKRQIYQHHCQLVKRAIDAAKRDYYRSKITSCSTSKALFQITNTLSGKEKTTSLPEHIPKQQLPDHFCEYFHDKVSYIRNELDKCVDEPSFEIFQGEKWNHFHAVDDKTVKTIVMKSAPKSCSLDPIPSDLLQQHIDDIIDVMTNLINASLRDGVVPPAFKTAAITPLIKKPSLDPNNLKNFRPVSNLPFISKILEKVVIEQLKNHLCKNNLVEPFQSAYRENHCTETALLRITCDLLNAADEGMVSILSLLDLSAAFDTLDHHIMLERLSLSFGLSGTVLKWFASYLSGRHFFVIIDGMKSELTPLEFGVPQGSVLGPMLYTLYTLPLGNVIRQHLTPFHMYADDTQLYKSAKPSDTTKLIMDVQSCIVAVKAWMTPNKLKMNDDKTEIMPVATSQKLRSLDIDHVCVGSDRVSFTKKAKNLGVVLDSSLSMDSQINHISKVTYLEIRRLGHLRSYLDIKEASTLASAFILSRLDYCNSLLAGLPNDKLDKLQRIQNSAARLVLRRSKYDHATPMLKELHWLPIRARIEYKLVLTCFKSKSDNFPSYISDLLVPYTPSRSLRSSSSNNFSIPRVHLKGFGERAFTFSGPSVWNALPQELKSCSTLGQFKKQLKTHLFKNYLN